MRYDFHPILVGRALSKFDGSASKLAAAIGFGCKRQHVEHWLAGNSDVPEGFVRRMHDLCSADPACWEFFPDKWWGIWPDLRGLPGAPVIGEAANDSEHKTRA
jgi:hypothetical protein